MKRSEVVLKMARYYSLKQCMVEQRYITVEEFCSQLLELAQDLGMEPPLHPTNGYEVREITPTGNINYSRRHSNEWEEE